MGLNIYILIPIIHGLSYFGIIVLKLLNWFITPFTSDKIILKSLMRYFMIKFIYTKLYMAQVLSYSTINLLYILYRII